MLWTDQTFIKLADLSYLESDAADIAASESVAVDGPSGVACRAIEEAARSLARPLQTWYGYSTSGDLTQGHLAALFTIGTRPTVQRKRATLDQIVISGRNATHWSALKNWAALYVLRALYRAAANRTREDRYAERADGFTKQIQGNAWVAVRAEGIPLIRNPLPCPAAFGGRNPGTWTASTVNGSGTVAADYDVAITYVDGTRTGTGASNNESAPSEAQTVTLASGKVLSVSIAGLNPPTGVVDVADYATAFVVPGKATHWNIYAGPAGSDLRLQNASPIAIGTTSWTASSDPLTTTALAGIGQFAEYFLPIQDFVFRG